MSNIVSTVAKDAESKGQFEDATMLYDLADVCFFTPLIFSNILQFDKKAFLLSESY